MSQDKFNGEFGINRGKEVKNNFGFDMIKMVDVGIEGQKMVAEIASRRGKHGQYFFKPMYEEKESFRQLEKYKQLRSQGVAVPEVFKPVMLPNNNPCVIISDLTEGGKYWVLGMNNPEVDDENFKKMVLSIPMEPRRRITEQLLLACEAAAQPTRKLLGGGSIYEFQPNAFLLAINSDNPSEVKIYVADLGLDVMARKPSERDQVLVNNLESAATFYSWMTGKVIQLGLKFQNLQAEIDKDGAETLLYRGFT